jgi:hypothetical protein
VFFPGKPLQPSLLFLGEAGAYPIAPMKGRPLERLARDKHSSLLRKSVRYGCKKFYSAGPRSKHASLLRNYTNYGEKKFYNIAYRCLIIQKKFQKRLSNFLQIKNFKNRDS